jgi:hypothetical protein
MCGFVDLIIQHGMRTRYTVIRGFARLYTIYPQDCVMVAVHICSAHHKNIKNTKRTLRKRFERKISLDSEGEEELGMMQL